MAFGVKSGKLLTTNDGIPYMWESGDVTTGVSNESSFVGSTAAAGDGFGRSVAIGCGKIVVGADFDDEGGSNYGAVYVFDIDGTELFRLDGNEVGESFGYSVAIGCGKIAVGAYTSGSVDYGAVYIYDLDGTNEIKIQASDKASGDAFGHSVAIGNNKIFVGAPEAHHSSKNDIGAVYIYDLDGTNEKKITGSAGDTNTHFGQVIKYGCGKFAIASEENPSGNAFVYLFDDNGNELFNIPKLDYTINRFGDAWGGAGGVGSFQSGVAIGCGRLVITNNNNSVGATNGAGTAWIFNLEGKLLNTIGGNTSVAENFGWNVAVGMGRIFIGHSNNSSATNKGAVNVYDLEGTFIEKIEASNGATNEYFGARYSDIDVGVGKLIVSATKPSLYMYDTPSVFTPFDARDLEKGNK